MKNAVVRFFSFLAGFRPCCRRDFVRQVTRLKKKNARLNAKYKMLRDTVQRQSETINRLSDRLSNRFRETQKRISDNRYLANLALPRERLRDSVIRWWYTKNPETPLNLDSPRTFGEKIQCLKLTADTPLMTRLADKYAVRDWVASKIGEQYLVPLLGVWEYAEEVDVSALPSRFVLKANHGSHMLHVVTDKTSLDLSALRVEMARWLATDYAFMMSPQLQYANIPRRIIAEAYLENRSGELYDWKVWCFKGKAHFIEFISRKDGVFRFVFLDRAWNPAPFGYRLPGRETIAPPPKPDNLDELLRLAETLAAGFEFVRVDFYRLDDGSYLFGEMTFSPAGGNGRFDPPEWNAKIGALFDFTPDNRIPGAPTE